MKKIEKRTRIKEIDEYQTFKGLIEVFPSGILSVVSDTFNLWGVLTNVLPALKEQILTRDGKLVIRPDSGDPVDIICGLNSNPRTSNKIMLYEDCGEDYRKTYSEPEHKGVIELLWDIFGGTVNEQGYKVLDPHIGAIYGDSITPERQRQIYERLAAKGFAATNIVLGVGSFTYQYNTRDTLGFCAKGAWFEHNGIGINIYKDPVTDDGTKKSLKGLCAVICNPCDKEVVGSFDFEGKGPHILSVKTECTFEEENSGVNWLQTIYEDGKFSNTTTLTEIRERLNGK